ncbi:MAG: TIGR04086 family membrane protein [Symbiobacteriia bacterium]
MAKPVRQQQREEDFALSGRAVLTGVLAALVTVAVGAVALSASAGAKLAGSPWEPLALTVVQVLAYGLAGFFAGHRARGLGWLHGGLAALLWVALALVFQLVAFSGGPSFGAVAYQALLAAAVGALAGMVGVNL